MQEGPIKTVQLRDLLFNYYNDKIVVVKRIPDAYIKDPSDDLMFIGPRCESWKRGPVWIDERAAEIEDRWIVDSDKGWVHYFNDTWTAQERESVFVVYILRYYVTGEYAKIGENRMALFKDRIVYNEKVKYLDKTSDETARSKIFETYFERFVFGVTKPKEFISNQYQ